MKKQKTIKKEVSSSGIGVHTGNKTTIIFKPAEVNTGVRFVRTDLEGSPVIEADVDNVVSVARGTTIGKGDVKVHTVEHVLAALMAFGVNNIIIEVDANEPPVGDGSAPKNGRNMSQRNIVGQVVAIGIVKGAFQGEILIQV